MIKSEGLGSGLRIKGDVIELSMEFEGIARGIREGFQDALGEEEGKELYEFCLERAGKSEAEANKDSKAIIEEAKKRDSSFVKEAEEHVVKRLLAYFERFNEEERS